MRKICLLTMAIFLLIVPQYTASSQVVDMQLELQPYPSFDQIVHEETYAISILFNNTGIEAMPGDTVNGQLAVSYTGNLLVYLTLNWRGKGSYDFGESTTGYTYSLLNIEHNKCEQARIEFKKSIAFPVNGTQTSVEYNYTFDRDAFQFRIKPFETVEVQVTGAVYYEAINHSTGMLLKGPVISSTSKIFYLLDETKISFLYGKYHDMKSEIKTLFDIVTLKTFDKVEYIQILEAMNSSILKGDYFEAQKIYQRYDEKQRAGLVDDLMGEISNSLRRIEELEALEDEIEALETRLELFNIEYETLESRYNALSNTYQKKQLELEAVKRSLTTAITMVFLSSIVFFFMGRRSKNFEAKTLSNKPRAK